MTTLGTLPIFDHFLYWNHLKKSFFLALLSSTIALGSKNVYFAILNRFLKRKKKKRPCSNGCKKSKYTIIIISAFRLSAPRNNPFPCDNLLFSEQMMEGKKSESFTLSKKKSTNL